MAGIAAAYAAVAAASLLTANGLCVAALACVSARARAALAAANAREAQLAAAATELACAGRESAHAVATALFAAARRAVPHVDGLLLFEGDEGGLHCTLARGERVAYFTGTPVARDDPTALVARALAAGHRAVLDAAGTGRVHPTDVAAIAVPLDDAPARSAVVVMVAAEPLAAAALDRLALLADLAAPCFRVARDREHDRRSAEYDALTGLLTPHAFRRRLAALVDRARAVPSASLALLFVDTDHFKRWNDTFGHAAGDALLRRIATALRGVSRERDLAARNGGDEFCVILAETDKAPAIERAELLRRRIAAIDPGISASIGVAAFPADAHGASELLERADAAMYHAKATGRDAVAYRLPNGELVRFTGVVTGPSFEETTNWYSAGSQG